MSFFEADFSERSKSASVMVAPLAAALDLGWARSFSPSGLRVRSGRIDVTVERLPRNAQLGAQLPDFGAGLSHRSLSETEFGRRHLERRPPFLPRARAVANPACVRSIISPRSNSANAAKMPNIRRSLAVVVSALASGDRCSRLVLARA